MRRPNIILTAVLSALLLGCLVAVYVTRDVTTRQAGPTQSVSLDPSAAVDSQLLETASRIAPLAETTDEQNQARKAVHLADHELDQAFASALRQAASYRPPATGPLRDLISRVTQLKVQVAADQNRIAQLTKPGADTATEQLQLVKARLALDQDDLDDAQQDLARQGGDPRATLERLFQDHQVAQHQAAQSPKNASPGPTATFVEQVRAWLSLSSLNRQLLSAQQQAATQTAALQRQHNQLEKPANASQPSGSPSGNTAERVATLQRLSDQSKSLAELDERVQDSRELAGVYQAWNNMVAARQRSVLHLLLNSLVKIFAILLAAILANLAIRRLFRESDRRRLHQVRVITAVVVQVLAAGFILLVIFGPPSQLSTIIGLATAGLTVALKDFIVSFFGWFALIGKNGIRIGDWVEINGVSGEVIEIGVLKTVLLELGNWTDTAHPTGRQVAFSNSFAMEGHYFNFSTTGQWLWDDLAVTLPATGDPYAMADEIRKLVEQETEADSVEAARDWERVTSRYHARSFSAKPAVSLRPTASGFELVVRYITRAPQRNAVKSKLFQLIVELLHKSAVEKAAKVS